MNKFLTTLAIICYISSHLAFARDNCKPVSEHDFDLRVKFISVQNYSDLNLVKEMVKDLVVSIQKNPEMIEGQIAGFRKQKPEQTDREEVAQLLGRMVSNDECKKLSTRRHRTSIRIFGGRAGRTSSGGKLRRRGKRQAWRGYALFGIKKLGDMYQVVINFLATLFALATGSAAACVCGVFNALFLMIAMCVPVWCCGCCEPSCTAGSSTFYMALTGFMWGYYVGLVAVEIPFTLNHPLTDYDKLNDTWPDLKEVIIEDQIF